MKKIIRENIREVLENSPKQTVQKVTALSLFLFSKYEKMHEQQAECIR